MPRLTKAEAIERRERVAEMYRAGLPVAEIADDLGIDVGSAHSLIYQMRKEGWNLPYRQAKGTTRTPRPSSSKR